MRDAFAVTAENKRAVAKDFGGVLLGGAVVLPVLRDGSLVPAFLDHMRTPYLGLWQEHGSKVVRAWPGQVIRFDEGNRITVESGP